MKKEMIMPSVFGGLFILVVLGYGAIFLYVPIPLLVKLVIGALVIIIAMAMLYVILQRNRELEEEKKDDLSKY